MASNIKFKRSSVAGKVPTSGQLPVGELAINTSDGIVYTQKDDGSIVPIAGAGSSVRNFIFVSKDGDDNNDGKSKPFRTIKKAAQAASFRSFTLPGGRYIDAGNHNG